MIRTFRVSNALMHSVAFVGESRFSALGPGNIIVWDARSGWQIHNLKVNAAVAGGSATGSTVLSGGLDGLIRVWNLDTGRAIQSFAGHAGGVIALALSPDGKTAVSVGDDGVIKLWDVREGRELMALAGHAGDIRALAFSPDGALVIGGGWDKTVRLWNAATGRLFQSFSGHDGAIRAVAFARNGGCLRIRGRSRQAMARLYR